MENNYFKDQIITYMGNKRKLLDVIEDAIDDVVVRLDKKSLSFGDGFSGSGIVSRLLKTKCNNLYVNDIAGYSHTINLCYLSNPSSQTQQKIKQYIDRANELAKDFEEVENPFISLHWSPNNKNISKSDRAYFTYENGKRIDVLRNYIESIPKKYIPYVLAPLIVECSIHNNTNGQFSAFYKDESGKGKYGGKNEIDIKRITAPIHIPYPIFYNNKCKVHCSQNDTNEWVKQFQNREPLDIVYYDPPYNKHPYNIYYFLLDIINDWDTTVEIPNSNRGQPLNWRTSNYNSLKNAKNAMIDLLKNTNARYILLSYNDGGIIPIPELDKLLQENEKEVTKIPINHKTYNKLKGISNYKREKEYTNVKEFLYIIKHI